MYNEDFRLLMQELLPYISLKTIIYIFAGLFGFYARWMRKWLKEEIDVGFITWLTSSMRTTISSMLTFLLSALAATASGQLSDITFVSVIIYGFTAGSTLDSFIGTKTKEVYTGKSHSIMSGRPTADRRKRKPKIITSSHEPIEPTE